MLKFWWCGTSISQKETQAWLECCVYYTYLRESITNRAQCCTCTCVLLLITFQTHPFTHGRSPFPFSARQLHAARNRINQCQVDFFVGVRSSTQTSGRASERPCLAHSRGWILPLIFSTSLNKKRFFLLLIAKDKKKSESPPLICCKLRARFIIINHSRTPCDVLRVAL